VNSPAYRSTRDQGLVNRILTRLRNRQAGFWFRILTKLAIGIPLSFIGPALLACIFNAMLLRARVHDPPSWLTLFWLSCLIVIPILYFVEWYHHGDFFLDTARSQGITSGNYFTAFISYSNWRYRNAEAISAFYTELLLFAPKQVFSAIADFRQRIQLTGDQMHRAAQLVADLSTSDTSLPIAQLYRPGESNESLRLTLQYLQFHDWVDINKTGDRAWLLTTARKRLNLS
jgi:hypothetical protein